MPITTQCSWNAFAYRLWPARHVTSPFRGTLLECGLCLCCLPLITQNTALWGSPPKQSSVHVLYLSTQCCSISCSTSMTSIILVICYAFCLHCNGTRIFYIHWLRWAVLSRVYFCFGWKLYVLYLPLLMFGHTVCGKERWEEADLDETGKWIFFSYLVVQWSNKTRTIRC